MGHGQQRIKMLEANEGLENIFENAVVEAEKRRHEYVTIEHVLLALVKDETIGTTLNEYKVVVGALIKEIEDYLDTKCKDIVTKGKEPVTPRKTASLERLMNRAFTQALFQGRQDVSSIDILISIFSEKKSYAAFFLKKHKVKIIFEPGRSIIGNTGMLITKIIYIKDSGRKKFIILDAAMNDLMRPALYGAFHRTLPVIKSNKISNKPYEFVGPICESTDKFITLKKFQKLKEKDLIAICDVGAYGMSLSSNYNLRPKPIELLIKGSKIKVIRKRQKHTEII